MDKMNEIVAYYTGCGSAKQTSSKFGVSHHVVRKCLVTAGVYDSPRYRAVTELAKEGLTPGEIAERLGTAKSTVSSYLPYSKGPYCDTNPTKNALAIRRCRKAKRKLCFNNKEEKKW